MPKPGECFIKMAESPFAEGEERFCFHGMQWHHVDTPESDKTPVVIKLQKDSNPFERFCKFKKIGDMGCQSGRNFFFVKTWFGAIAGIKVRFCQILPW